tara:strand:+ start:372 stop:1118 length:747 start_codon:yes stop_codon:yes gene_type:complete
VSSNLLILHTWPPGCAGRALDRAVFAANVPEARRLVLNDPMHGLRSRFPAALDPLSEELRVVTGRLPFGYLDGQRDRILHVCVISDPELAFLRFAACLSSVSDARVINATGRSGADLPLTDPELLVARLLELQPVRARRIGVATRLCAGLPCLSDRPVDQTQLAAALANLGRVNALCGREEHLDAFARYLADVMGWPAPEKGLAEKLTAPILAPCELSPKLRDRLRQALDMDIRLHAAVSGELGACVA